ncbi:MAG TPA: hypothetical protein VMS23_06040, partial [Terrimicrobiaceae bacterium]|nr:hypothetical protein [Terrimicrobiaceae bacterium]
LRGRTTALEWSVLIAFLPPPMPPREGEALIPSLRYPPGRFCRQNVTLSFLARLLGLSVLLALQQLLSQCSSFPGIENSEANSRMVPRGRMNID